MMNGDISIPKSFLGEDTREWFQKFEICSSTNGWDTAMKTKKLPTLLKGEVLTNWMELTDNEKEDYKVTKERLIKHKAPMEFVSLEEFQK